MNKINITFDNKSYRVKKGISVLKAAQNSNVFIPSWCAIQGQKGSQVCRLCIVQIQGIKGEVNSCAIEAKDNMKVTVNQLELNNTRKTLMNLLLKSHKNCINPNCELETLAKKMGIESPIQKQSLIGSVIQFSPYLKYDKDLCIHCERCVNTCTQQKSLKVIHKTREISLITHSPKNTCIECGDCIFACKAGALTQNNI